MSMDLVPLKDNSLAVTQQSDGFNIVTYIKDFCEVMVPNLPAPLPGAEEQMRACMEKPTRSDISHFEAGRRVFDYVSIEYIETRLTEIFGQNWNEFPLPPGYITEVISDEKIMLHLEVVLVIRWANGSVTPYIGRGSALYLPKTNAPNLSFAKSTARAEAVKNAARHLGPSFGMGLKSLVESGQIEDMSFLEAYNLVKASIGDRLIVSSSKPDEVLTEVNLEALAQSLFGVGVEELQGTALLNLTRIIRDMPRISQKIDLVGRLQKSGHKITMEEPYNKLLNLDRKADDDLMSNLP